MSHNLEINIEYDEQELMNEIVNDYNHVYSNDEYKGKIMKYILLKIEKVLNERRYNIETALQEGQKNIEKALDIRQNNIEKVLDERRNNIEKVIEERRNIIENDIENKQEMVEIMEDLNKLT